VQHPVPVYSDFKLAANPQIGFLGCMQGFFQKRLRVKTG
jgi:hypothetical protein